MGLFQSPCVLKQNFYRRYTFMMYIHLDSSTTGAQNSGGASGLEHLGFTILCIVISYFMMWFPQFYSSPKLLLILTAFVYYAWGQTWALWKEDYLGNSHVQKCMLFNNMFRQHQLQSKRILCWGFFCGVCCLGHTQAYRHTNLQGGKGNPLFLKTEIKVMEAFFEGSMVKYKSG